MAHSNTVRRENQGYPAENDNDAVRKRTRLATSIASDFKVWDNAAPAQRESTRRRRKPWSPGKVASVATLYLSDIEKTIRGRYPKGAHHADDSRRYFDAACNLMVMRFIAMKDGGRNPRKLDLFGWASRFTPALTFEQPRDWFDYVEAEIMKAFGSNALPPLLPDADEMGEMIGVTQDEFERFDLRSIGRIDNKAPQRLQTDRAKRAAREGKRRKDRGSNPHTESMAQTKPWLALDPPISRAKYYRKIGNGELPPHPSMRSVRQKRTT